MPAAGGRRSTSDVYGLSENGQYYSSSQKSTNSAYKFYFSDIEINPQSYSNYNNGYSVRCFKNSPNSKTLTLHANRGSNAVI